MSLQDIPVRVDPSMAQLGVDAQIEGDIVDRLADALLQEVLTALEQFLAQGETQVIELKSLPMTEEQHDAVMEKLGQGEVSVTLSFSGDASSTSHVWETRYAGVWWISHYNHEGEVIAEQIEISQCPEILKSHRDDIRLGYEQLKAQL